MNKHRELPEVNAGSMADIAFLLLIFFLVTTTLETDEGIKRMLPRTDGEPGVIAERNILRLYINASNQLMVEKEIVDIMDLRQITTGFLDNGLDVTCDYCKGSQLENYSDNPQKAVVSIAHSRNTTYEAFISVQNELVGAYADLRNREAKRLFGVTFESLKLDHENAKNDNNHRLSLMERIKTVQELFPMKISEAEIKD